jgi:drug/metabolite transporter (DMT)-like permease
VLRLADRQPDLTQAGVRRDVGEELPEFLERIGLQLAEVGIHRRDVSRRGALDCAEDYKGHRRTVKGQAQQIAGPGAAREQRLAIGALLGGALVWGVIWYPYRLLRDAGVDGIVSSTLSYGIAFVLGLLIFRRSPLAWAPSWTLLWLALAAAGCNLGYVLATLNGEVVRVLLLFYLAPCGPSCCRACCSTSASTRRCRRHRPVAARCREHALAAAGRPAGTAGSRRLARPDRRLRVCPVQRAFPAGVAIYLSKARSWPLSPAVVIAGALLLLAGVGSLATCQVRRRSGCCSRCSAACWSSPTVVVQFGLARVAANRAVVIMLTEIGFAALAAWLLADEALAPRDWLGGALIVAASLFSAR